MIYDKIVNQVAKDVFLFWKKNYRPGAIKFEKIYDVDDKKGRELYFDLEAYLFCPIEPNDMYDIDGNADAGSEHVRGYINLKFIVSYDKFPTIFSDVYYDLCDVIRHEIEHLTQSGYNVRKGKKLRNDFDRREKIKLDPNYIVKYLTLKKEVDAQLQGLYMKAKKMKLDFKEVIDNFFNYLKLTDSQKKQVLDVWVKRAIDLNLVK